MAFGRRIEKRHASPEFDTTKSASYIEVLGAAGNRKIAAACPFGIYDEAAQTAIVNARWGELININNT